VPLNQNCSVYSDIHSLQHHLTTRQFHILLKPERRCDQPTFLLRLSGAALYKLDAVHETEGWFAFQYPPLADAGEYFLDAIVLFCQAYNPNNMTKLCMENVKYRNNQVNERYSFVVNDTDTDRTVPPLAHWRNTQPPIMLPTRHQRLVSEPRYRSHCTKIIFDVYCFPEASEVEPDKNYTWVNGVNGLADTERVFLYHTSTEDAAAKAKANDTMIGRNTSQIGAVAAVAVDVSNITYSINVCFVGDSHARELMLNAAEYANSTTYITFTLVVVIFPTLFTPSLFLNHKCSIAVLSFGQWPLTQFAPTPFTLTLFTAQVQTVMDKILTYQAEGGSTKVFFRTENYNGLAARMTKCPHQDYRTPPSFDALNTMVHNLCTNHSIPFINLHDVIGPMWDAAIDYSHPIHHVLRAEVDIILHAVFSDVISRNGSLRTYPLSALQRLHEDEARVTFADRTAEQMRKVHGYV
jgi:hypothetical protein